ncbi:MAG: PBP1A family penicillin-binding protein [Candidatus Neomarinimicrobiota bacterium]
MELNYQDVISLDRIENIPINVMLNIINGLKNQDMKKWKEIFRFSLKLVGFGFISGLLIIFIFSRRLPSIEQLENFDPDLVTQIYSSDDVLIDELFQTKRVFVDTDSIPQNMKNATIASEDKRFEKHWGIDIKSFFRAVAINILSMSYEQGFSSITQQLSRNLYETIGFENSIWRKIKEIITAIQTERMYTKDEILGMYLNTVHFGHGTYGVEAAAKKFFGKKTSELTLSESAMLVGVLPSPASYSPINHWDRSVNRRDIVLNLMLDQKYITEAEQDSAKTITALAVLENPETGFAPYFVEYVRRFLEKEDTELDINIYRDGLKIYTTLDSRLQAIAAKATKQQVLVNQQRYNNQVFNDEELFYSLVDSTIYSADTVKMMMRGELTLYEELRNKLLVQTAFVALDPKTGAILAMIGGRLDYHDQYNRAVQALRQPGSVFKPFIYTTAIDNGYPITEQLLNQRVVLNRQDGFGEWIKWMPRNDDESTGGLTTLREGLKKSLNLISIRMVQQKLAPANQIKKTAERMKFSTPILPVDAIALGVSEVYPIEIVAAYAAFANRGVYSKPFIITRIEDRFGNILAEYFPEQEEVLNERTAYVVTSMMESVLNGGTGSRSRWAYGFRRPAAGKTGTSQDYRDAWFVGFTPQIVAGTWFGIDGPPIVSLGERQFGNLAALPVWAKFMKAAHDTLKLPEEKFIRPDGVLEIEICSESKKLPVFGCPTEKEIFITGTEPVGTCEVHRIY